MKKLILILLLLFAIFATVLYFASKKKAVIYDNNYLAQIYSNAYNQGVEIGLYFYLVKDTCGMNDKIKRDSIKFMSNLKTEVTLKLK